MNTQSRTTSSSNRDVRRERFGLPTFLKPGVANIIEFRRDVTTYSYHHGVTIIPFDSAYPDDHERAVDVALDLCHIAFTKHGVANIRVINATDDVSSFILSVDEFDKICIIPAAIVDEVRCEVLPSVGCTDVRTMPFGVQPLHECPEALASLRQDMVSQDHGIRRLFVIHASVQQQDGLCCSHDWYEFPSAEDTEPTECITFHQPLNIIRGATHPAVTLVHTDGAGRAATGTRVEQLMIDLFRSGEMLVRVFVLGDDEPCPCIPIDDCHTIVISSNDSPLLKLHTLAPSHLQYVPLVHVVQIGEDRSDDRRNVEYGIAASLVDIHPGTLANYSLMTRTNQNLAEGIVIDFVAFNDYNPAY